MAGDDLKEWLRALGAEPPTEQARGKIGRYIEAVKAAADRIEQLEEALRRAEASIMLIVGKEPDGSEHPISSDPYKTAAQAVQEIRALTRKDSTDG